MEFYYIMKQKITKYIDMQKFGHFFRMLKGFCIQ